MARSSTTAGSSSSTDQSWKNRLDQAMRTRGVSQRELARMCDLGATSVRHSLQAGTDVRLSTIHLYAKCLGVSPTWLAFGKDIKS